MEYEIVDRVLVLKGNFEALSTGVDGGRKATKSILNIQVPRDFSHDDPTSYIKENSRIVEARWRLHRASYRIEMKNVQMLNDACVTVFVTAGLTNPSSFGTINIIVIFSAMLSEGRSPGR